MTQIAAPPGRAAFPSAAKRLSPTFAAANAPVASRLQSGALDGASLSVFVMRDPVMMSGRWHIKAFAALSIAVLCMALGWLVPEQGYFTVRVFGSEFGLARSKASRIVCESCAVNSTRMTRPRNL